MHKKLLIPDDQYQNHQYEAINCTFKNFKFRPDRFGLFRLPPVFFHIKNLGHFFESFIFDTISDFLNY